VLREPMSDSGPVRIAVVVTEDGKLSSASVLGVEPEHSRVWSLVLPAAAVVALGEQRVGLADAYAAGRIDRVVAGLETVSGTEVAGLIVIDASASEAIGSGKAGPSRGSSRVIAQHRAVVMPLLRTVAETRDRYGLFALGRQAVGYVTTDLSLRELSRLATVLSGVTDKTAAFASPEVYGADENPSPDPADARRLVARMVAGKALTRPGAGLPRPGSVSVEVQNGAGVDGVASDAARALREGGFEVGTVGNANQFVYKDTLVIHRGDQLAARAVRRSLPVGRLVESRGMYRVKTDVLVIVGKDWKHK
jgi:hypothetical protein